MKHQEQTQAEFSLVREEKRQGPVECLGKTFESDGVRREYFLEKLREKLRDSEFRKIDGFPIGSDEDILALSDPPYYTACPNPFIDDFIKHYGKPYDPSVPYSKEPFAADVSEGKNDPLYNIHAYPTKVPPGAIQPLIEHYTNGFSLVLDPFAGTGMTGVAIAQTRNNVRGILQDLSPTATHIAAALQDGIDKALFQKSAEAILTEIQKECAWMYASSINGVQAQVRYYVWSDVYSCDACAQPIRIWDIEGVGSVGGLKEKKPCPHCGSLVSKQSMTPMTEVYYDHVLNRTSERIKSEPVLKVIVEGNRSQKLSVDEHDIEVVTKIHSQPIPYDVPTAKMLFKNERWGDQWRSSYHLGVSHAHHFYSYRNLWILCAIWDRIERVPRSSLKRILRFWFTASLSRVTRLNRYMAQHDRHVGPLAGTLFIGPIQAEISPFYFFNDKMRDISTAFPAEEPHRVHKCVVSTSSSTRLSLPDNSVDFIFTDPPFGDNLMYSELNFLVEAWLRVYTHQSEEAVISVTQNKGLRDFESLIKQVFSECFRVLKPGRWMVVEFHNSRNTVWTAIQEALGASGFIIADVRTLDKQKGTTKQLTQAGTVKQDLIITAYKPNGGLEDRFKLEAGTEEGAWDFIRTHLKQLPVFVAKDGKAEIVAERQNYLLFDRMVAFHVQRGVTVPLSAAEFYQGLAQRLSERDSMYFLPNQVAEYDKKRMTVKEIMQLEIAVSDETSAIQWLKQQLTLKPKTFQELHPQFLQEIGGWQKHEKPLELMELLGQNFLRYDGEGEVPSQIHSYLSTNFKELRKLPKDAPLLQAKAKDRWYVPDPSKAGDLEKLRERALLREFEEYRESKQKRLKVFRLEAVRAGFKNAWADRDYATIIDVASRIPENILQEDPKLLMWYDQALTRTGDTQ